MTVTQKKVIRDLLNGRFLLKSMNHNGIVGYKMYSGKMLPELFISSKVIDALDQSVFRKDKKNRLILSAQNIRRLHGNHWIKKLYKQEMRKQKTATNLTSRKVCATSPPPEIVSYRKSPANQDIEKTIP